MGLFGGLFGGGSKQTVNQTTTNETEVNTAVEVKNDFIIDTDPIANAFNGIQQALSELGILSIIGQELQTKANTETQLALGILDAESNKIIASGVIESGLSVLKNIGIFAAVTFSVWALLKIIKG
ncbi:MAG: hypothetical protein PQ612_06445 [Rickettsiales bacterium]|nr:hypothetical protein [Pseudomonadota bacterium]MDA0966612.1 hypothetical protein [Pseudomonadota bacterium]MDG4543640.1 hypothetical protein [Rickettsiales bacterium]MDG4545787.1 hypothetical protein [Rickettsiales bacterium]MDG4547439.1 hypothetical protein [Rickettsiales bacterium]